NAGLPRYQAACVVAAALADNRLRMLEERSRTVGARLVGTGYRRFVSTLRTFFASSMLLRLSGLRLPLLIHMPREEIVSPGVESGPLEGVLKRFSLELVLV